MSIFIPIDSVSYIIYGKVYNLTNLYCCHDYYIFVYGCSNTGRTRNRITLLSDLSSFISYMPIGNSSVLALL